MQHKLIMTKYEKARVIGIRALQLSNGAPAMVKTDNLTSVIQIAEKELMEYRMPIIIKRKMPDGSSIDIKATEMIIY